ncbi:IS1182 family transposase [Sulfurirhabdus autotrophica]|uniref:IS4 family transposase n=1 Tax=Sulfurirhabdus autotrophica TaxID=1706046 RepID=A0A4R3YAQ0_9PROT|nr:IS1182 family transposase [Sulfurirhabdus autotrophica]TCV89485.1 IS4 family transposase [Sulfurirhabdus autotrophica]
MKRFIQGQGRNQVTLLPECLDDYISEDNPVRVIDVFVEELNLIELGFTGTSPAATGRPGYHPATLLKIYLYGYLNRIQSSRRLEREAQRNIELMWLTERLSPDFKTIADFRHDNGTGIRNTCRRFVAMCRQFNLFTQAMVAIDGSKFKTVNNRDKNFTQHKLEQRMKQIDESIERYMRALDSADRAQTIETEFTTARLKEKLAKLRKHMQALKAVEQNLQQQPDNQLSLTDPDSRSMATSGRGTGMVGYNVQTAVDTQHHLIVAHEVTNLGHDRTQLANMAFQAREATGADALEVIADRGYYKGPELLACEQAGITAFVPKTMTSNNKTLGLVDKRDFIYIKQDNEYLCPAGERLAQRHSTIEHEMKINVYYTRACHSCALKAQCTTAKERRIRRWEHEDVLDVMQARLDNNPGKMKQRRCTVEHVFGTLKLWMGSAHFLMKTIEHVSTEMSLHVLAYNLRRVMNIMGISEMLTALRLAVA